MNLSTAEWVSIIGVLLGTLTPVLLGMSKILVGQLEKHLDLRFEALEERRAQAQAQWREQFGNINTIVRNNEQRLTQLLIDLPHQYQRREDAIRQEVAITHRLDALAAKVDNLLERRRGADCAAPTDT